jgi:serine/threonine-protein kinase
VKFCPNDGQTLRSAAPATDLVGQVVADRYHIIKKLGEGGMGQVYLGEHVKMGRRSAIKVMNPSMVHDPDAVARFNREAANASRITHPHVCAIYDFGETADGLIFLAMEFIEGEPLTDLLQRERALPVERAARIFYQTADALQAAHDLGIVHRDLKPDNIMLSRGRDGSDVVKVVDFGIAKAVGGDEAGQKVTKTGLVVGTPEFMSPEQLAGDKLDGRSDLYALALVFFRMLTGHLPFEADTVQETMIKRLTDEPQKLAAARPDLQFPPGLQAVLDTALTRTPVDRYQTVAKFADDVRSVTGMTGGAGTRAVPVTRASSEGATQLLDTTATKQIGARKPKRSLIPVAIGAVVLLGGAGAAVKLLGGSNANELGTPTDSAAVRDSGRTTGPPTTTTRNPAGPPAAPAAPGPVPPPGPVVINSGIDPSRAKSALDDLSDASLEDKMRPPTIRDSALKFYNAQIRDSERAYAASIIVQTYLDEGQRTLAREWAQRAQRLAPNDTLIARLVRSFEDRP